MTAKFLKAPCLCFNNGEGGEEKMENEVSTVDNCVELFKAIEQKVERPEVAVALVQELGKNYRTELMQMGRGSVVAKSSAGDQPASTKQINYLKFLGVEIPSDLNRKDASQLIDDKVAEIGR